MFYDDNNWKIMTAFFAVLIFSITLYSCSIKETNAHHKPRLNESSLIYNVTTGLKNVECRGNINMKHTLHYHGGWISEYIVICNKGKDVFRVMINDNAIIVNKRLIRENNGNR